MRITPIQNNNVQKRSNQPNFGQLHKGAERFFKYAQVLTESGAVSGKFAYLSELMGRIQAHPAIVDLEAVIPGSERFIVRTAEDQAPRYVANIATGVRKLRENPGMVIREVDRELTSVDAIQARAAELAEFRLHERELGLKIARAEANYGDPHEALWIKGISEDRLEKMQPRMRELKAKVSLDVVTQAKHTELAQLRQEARKVDIEIGQAEAGHGDPHEALWIKAIGEDRLAEIRPKMAQLEVELGLDAERARVAELVAELRQEVRKVDIEIGQE